jgi:tRNA(Ile)-lysidine synthase
VAVSGGPDSVALLHALTRLRPEYALELAVCHVHHGLRPEADRDAAFVADLADRLGCPAVVEQVSVRPGHGRSLEEAARAARYAALDRVAGALGATRVALGHTADDQAETVLMRLLQGAGPRGLAGMPVRRGPLIRPLLEIGRATVLAHLEAHGLTWVEDASNRDRRFLRSRIRHELLPWLRAQGWGRLDDALCRTARACRETVEALERLLDHRAAALAQPGPGGRLVPDAVLEGLPPGAVKALLRRAILDVAPGPGLRGSHLVALHALLEARPGARVRLPGGTLVERTRAGLWIVSSRLPLEPVALQVPGETVAAGVRLHTELGRTRVEPPPDGRWEAWFDADRLSGALRVRAADPGDRVVPYGMGGPVRVAGVLTAAAVPRVARQGWPLLVCAGPAGEEVLWVIGIRRGAAAPIRPETRSMLRIRASGWPAVAVQGGSP